MQTNRTDDPLRTGALAGEKQIFMENWQENRCFQPPFEVASLASGENGFRRVLWDPATLPLAEAAQQAKIFATFAAKHHFQVGFEEILAKLATSDETILVTTHEGTTVAFASQLNPCRIQVNRSFSPLVRYMNGIIVDPDAGRHGICSRLLNSAGSDVDIVVGHTQNPHILAAFKKSFDFVWPSQNGAKLNKAFAEQLANYLESIGRPRSFNRVTGLVTRLYPGPLYQNGDDSSMGTLGTGGDGIAILGFNSAETYMQAVENVATGLQWSPSVSLRIQPTRSLEVANDACDSLVIGWGHSARDLHEPCMQKAALRDIKRQSISGRMGVVECDTRIGPASRMPFFRRIGEVSDFDPEKTVVHVCTGPAERATVVQEAARCGFKRFILEKPLVASRSQMDELLKTVEDYSLDIVVNFPWLSTPLTSKLKAIIDAGEHGELRALSMLQTKSRLHRLHEAAGHDTAFEIEAPHQASLSLFLAGERATVLDASCHGMSSDSGVIPAMGGASMLLNHGGAISNLRSDLDCPVKERRIELYFQDRWRCVGWYPADGSDGTQRLSQFDQNGRPRYQEKFFDDPLTSFFIESYRYFSGNGPRPVSSLALAVATANLISTAKSICGIEVEPLEAAVPGGKA